MKIKTNELEGMALCYTLCMIEIPHLVWGETIGEHHASRQIIVTELTEPECYSPFMNWEMFGPIIEREKIRIEPSATHSGWFAVTDPGCYAIPSERHYADGPTPLIAAMRCYVASKLGDEVEIPDALTGG